MIIVQKKLTVQEIRELASHVFGDMVKGVVDVEREIIALDAELHADLEALLLHSGSRQDNLWGFNLYPDLIGEDFVELDSLINIRPSQGNRSRRIEADGVRARILDIISKWIVP